MTVLPSTYFGNILYYALLLRSEAVIDIHEHYVKQSYRNRCEILTANGKTALTVNVVKPSNFNKPAFKDIRIDYSKRWQHQHWQSIVSAYRSAPYFDHYVERFEPLLFRRFEFLLDLNREAMEAVFKCLNIPYRPVYSEKYIEPDDTGTNDLRNIISSKSKYSPGTNIGFEPYWQVFSDRFEFIPNLSVLDLIFCEGPAAGDIIRSTVTGSCDSR